MRRRPSPVVAHVLLLAVGAMLSIVAATRLGLFYDDWAILVPSHADPWAPHVGHWTTTPYLLFHALRDVFGLSSFVPFAVPVTIAHLALAHLVWRLSLRVGVDPWLATAGSALVVFLGAGSENILWAFQVGFIGAMALCLGALLLVMRPRPRAVTVALAAVLTALAPTFSGTALPLIVVVAIVAFLRWGWTRTLAVVAPAVVLYLAWYLLRGREAPAHGRAESLAALFGPVPEYALEMLSDGFGRAFPIAVLGPIFVSVVAIWGVLTWTRASERSRPAYVLFLAAPLFALLTAYSRVGLGIETATSSRYLYFIIPVMLPLLLLALDAARRAWRLSKGGVLVLLGILVLYNAGGLVATLAKRAEYSALTVDRIHAALAVLAEDADGDIDDFAQVYPRWAPPIVVADLRGMAEEGWIAQGPYDEFAYLGAVLALETHVDAPDPLPVEACAAVEGETRHEFSPRFTIEAPGPAVLTIALARGGAEGDQRTLLVEPGTNSFHVDAPPGSRLVLAHASSRVLVCDRE